MWRNIRWPSTFNSHKMLSHFLWGPLSPPFGLTYIWMSRIPSLISIYHHAKGEYASSNHSSVIAKSPHLGQKWPKIAVVFWWANRFNSIFWEKNLWHCLKDIKLHLKKEGCAVFEDMTFFLPHTPYPYINTTQPSAHYTLFIKLYKAFIHSNKSKVNELTAT